MKNKKQIKSEKKELIAKSTMKTIVGAPTRVKGTGTY